jgi:assimilatory nitrate reductase catalytic subunit
VTNSERRISRVRAAVPAPGLARDDWAIAVDVARRIEALMPPARTASKVPGLQSGTMFPYATAEDVWKEHRESTRGRDLDITGMTYAMLDQAPEQWPLREGQTAGAARLYADGHFPTADGRACFTAPAWRGVAEPRDARYPLSLNTGRLRDQWHGASRTGTLGRLFAHAPEPTLDMHPQELSRRHWQAGDLVRVASRRGELVLPVAPSEAVAPAQAYIAMHWGSEWVAGDGVNALTDASVCPLSHQPELKHAAVRVEAAGLPWQIAAAAWLPAQEAWRLREALRALFPRFGYAHCVPFGREQDREHGGAGEAAAAALTGLRFRAALPGPAEPALLQAVEAALGLAGVPSLRYADARSGQTRLMALQPDGTLRAYLLAGDTAADAWVLPLLQARQPAAAFGRALLAARPLPPSPMRPASPQVCACHDVSEARIHEVAAATTGDAIQKLQAVQQALRCGTECGSCLPAVKAAVQRLCQLEPVT